LTQSDGLGKGSDLEVPKFFIFAFCGGILAGFRTSRSSFAEGVYGETRREHVSACCKQVYAAIYVGNCPAVPCGAACTWVSCHSTSEESGKLIARGLQEGSKDVPAIWVIVTPCTTEL
jgi:hypothetical protein